MDSDRFMNQQIHTTILPAKLIIFYKCAAGSGSELAPE